MSMTINESFKILEGNDMKVVKSPEEIAKRRWRSKVRRAKKKIPELSAKLEKMYDRICDFDRMIEAPWVSRALANEDYKSVDAEKEKIKKMYMSEVAEPFDKIADDIFRAIDHDKNSPLYKVLSKFCRKLEGIQFFHSNMCPETEDMRRINWV